MQAEIKHQSQICLRFIAPEESDKTGAARVSFWVGLPAMAHEWKDANLCAPSGTCGTFSSKMGRSINASNGALDFEREANVVKSVRKISAWLGTKNGHVNLNTLR